MKWPISDERWPTIGETVEVRGRDGETRKFQRQTYKDGKVCWVVVASKSARGPGLIIRGWRKPEVSTLLPPRVVVSSMGDARRVGI